jgi:hypothetical protein
MDYKTHSTIELNSGAHFPAHKLGDFTDADMFMRSCPGAHHAAWQLSHLTAFEAGAQHPVAPTHAVTLLDGFRELFTNQANITVDDAAKFAPFHNNPLQTSPFHTKAKLIEIFQQICAVTVACVEWLTPDQLDARSREKYAGWAPTLGTLVAGQLARTITHVGQCHVIRRMLGKPALL